MEIQVKPKERRKVNLKNGRNWIEAFIEIEKLLPWPRQIIYDNKVFRHENLVIAGIGQYLQEPDFLWCIAKLE